VKRDCVSYSTVEHTDNQMLVTVPVLQQLLYEVLLYSFFKRWKKVFTLFMFENMES
jgi:hypothetical protein